MSRGGENRVITSAHLSAYFLSALRFAARKPAALRRLAFFLYPALMRQDVRERTRPVSTYRAIFGRPRRGLVHRCSHITALLKVLNSTDRFQKRCAAQSAHLSAGYSSDDRKSNDTNSNSVRHTKPTAKKAPVIYLALFAKRR